MLDFARPATFGLAAALGFVAATSVQTCGWHSGALNQTSAACGQATSLERGIGGTGIMPGGIQSFASTTR